MMISPYSFVDEYKDKSYKELLEVRDLLMEKILKFEKNEIPHEAYSINPSPEVQYQCHLLYMAKLFDLIAEKYRETDE